MSKIMKTENNDENRMWKDASAALCEFVGVDPARKWAQCEKERDEAIAARKASAADWLGQTDQANARVSQALQQVALAERERDEAREMQAKALRDSESTEREVEAMLERAIKAERERDAARAELEMWRDGNILHEIHRDELEEAKRNAGIRVTDKIPNENNHPNYGGTSLL